jgi:chromate transporter
VLRILLEFTVIGATAFGGGSATISAMRRTCLRRGWLNEEEFFETLIISRVTPGTTIIAQVYLIGRRIAGYPGLIAATVGLLAPAFGITLGLAKLYLVLKGSDRFDGPLAMVSAAAAGFALALAVELLLDCLPRSRRIRGAAWVTAYGALAYFVNSSMIVIGVALLAGVLVPRAFAAVEAEDAGPDSS